MVNLYFDDLIDLLYNYIDFTGLPVDMIIKDDKIIVYEIYHKGDNNYKMIDYDIKYDGSKRYIYVYQYGPLYHWKYKTNSVKKLDNHRIEINFSYRN